jgi:hypothetical protein
MLDLVESLRKNLILTAVYLLSLTGQPYNISLKIICSIMTSLEQSHVHSFHMLPCPSCFQL